MMIWWSESNLNKRGKACPSAVSHFWNASLILDLSYDFVFNYCSSTSLLHCFKHTLWIIVRAAVLSQSVQRLTTGWTVRGSKPCGEIFSVLVQNDPEAQPTSCKVGDRSLSLR